MFWSCINEVYRAFTDDFVCKPSQKQHLLHTRKAKLQISILHKGVKNDI